MTEACAQPAEAVDPHAPQVHFEPHGVRVTFEGMAWLPPRILEWKLLVFTDQTKVHVVSVTNEHVQWRLGQRGLFGWADETPLHARLSFDRQTVCRNRMVRLTIEVAVSGRGDRGLYEHCCRRVMRELQYALMAQPLILAPTKPQRRQTLREALAAN